MSSSIAAHWQQIAAETNFCCESHAEEARVMFFTGAMAALHALTGWDPDRPGFVIINAVQIAKITDELTVMWHQIDSEAKQSEARH